MQKDLLFIIKELFINIKFKKDLPFIFIEVFDNIKFKKDPSEKNLSLIIKDVFNH